MNKEQFHKVDNLRTPVVKVEKLIKVYKTGDSYLSVLNGLNLTVYRGETVAIVGKSGSGKSTLLNLIGGLDLPTDGTITVRGKSIENCKEDELSKFRNRYIGFIFQFHHLLSEFTVVENIMMPYLINNFDTYEAYKRSAELMELLGIYDKEHLKPNKLSGGECQRVAIARSLVNSPEIILADEPTGNLDEYTAEYTKKLLFNIVRKLHHTMIIVTHNRSIIKEANTAYFLNFGVLNDLLDRGI